MASKFLSDAIVNLPKEVVDFGHNQIDVSQYGNNVSRATLRVDKFSFVSEPVNREQLTILLSRIKSSKNYSVKNYKTCGGISKHYQRCIEIRHNKHQHVGINIHYKPNWNKNGFIRFELSPQHINNQRMAYLIDWLANPKRLGDAMFQLLDNAWVTRIDIALDLYGVSTFDYYFGLMEASKGQINGKDTVNRFGSLRLGSYKSYLHIVVYDKTRANKVQIKEVENGGVSLELIHNFDMRFIRIEARIAPLKNRKIKLNQLLLSDKIPNPFEKLSIYPTSIKELLIKYNEFVKMLDEFTVPEAMNRIEKGFSKNKIREILQQNRVELFDQKRLWDEQQLRCIALLGFLQQPAYWQKDIRERCSANQLRNKKK